MTDGYAMIVIKTDFDLSLEELCAYCHTSQHYVTELIEYGVIIPEGQAPQNWRFDTIQIRRLHRILRLQHDLEVNLPGAILAIDLLEQIEELKTKVEILEKHLDIN